jgi:hypothetical protein
MDKNHAPWYVVGYGETYRKKAKKKEPKPVAPVTP